MQREGIVIRLLQIAAIALLPAIAFGQTRDSVQVDVSRVSLAAGERSIAGDDFRRWPIRTLEDWLALNSGVTVPYPGSREVYVRGARRYSNIYVLNGGRIDNPLTGQLAATISPDIIERMSLDPLAQHSPLPPVSGGVVGIHSRTGQERLSGSFEYTTDRLTTGFNQDWYNLAVSGPIKVDSGVSFAFAAEWREAEDWQPSPIAEQLFDAKDGRLPGNDREGHSVHTALNWPLNSHSTLLFALDVSHDDFRTYAHEFYYYPDHSPKTSESLTHFQAAWRHGLDGGGRVRIEFSIARGSTTTGDGVVFDDLAAYDRGFDNPGYDAYGLFRVRYFGGAEPYLDYFRTYATLSSSVITAVDIPVDTHIGLSLGITGTAIKVKNYEHFLPSEGYNRNFINRYGYDSVGVSGEGVDLGGEEYAERVPKTFDAYSSLTFRFEPIRLSVAGRYQYLDLDSEVLYEAVNVYKAAGAFGSSASSASASQFSPSGELEVEINDELRATGRFALTYDLAGLDHWLFGPGFYDWGVLQGFERSRGAPLGFYPKKATKADFTIAYRSRANLAIDFTLFHHSYRQQWLLNYNLSYSGFYANYMRFGESNARGFEIQLDLTPRPWFRSWCSYTYGDVTGTAVGLDATFVPMEGVFKYPADNSLPLRHEQQHKVTAILDLHTGERDEYHFPGGRAFENLSLVIATYWASGFHYTETYAYDAVLAGPFVGRPIGDRNNATLPDIFQVDLKLERSFTFGACRLTPFLWIRNLLDRTNITTVYTPTGEPDNTGFLDSPEGQARLNDPAFGAPYELAYQRRQNDPTNYAPPRQIYLGLRAEF